MRRFRMRTLSAVLVTLTLLGGCAARKTEVAAVAPTPVPAPAPAPRPTPPSGAAPGLVTPMRAADGSYPTPNRQLSPAGMVWHVRAALNVAALSCDGPGGTLASQYSQWIGAQKTALAAAHTALNREYKDRFGAQAQDRFDDAMTRLYNFFAQPPVQKRFCAVAAPLIAKAAGTGAGAGGLEGFAATALPELDAPFQQFYADYDAYRTALAQWQTPQPRIMVGNAVLLAGESITGPSQPH